MTGSRSTRRNWSLPGNSVVTGLPPNSRWCCSPEAMRCITMKEEAGPRRREGRGRKRRLQTGFPGKYTTMKIALGADHAGQHLKQAVYRTLVEAGHEVKDFGAFTEEPV